MVVMQLDMLAYVQIERLNTRDVLSKNFNTPAQPRAGGISLSGFGSYDALRQDGSVRYDASSFRKL